MIARYWSARTTLAHAPKYASHLSSHVLAQLRSLEGYAGAVLLQRETLEGVEIVVITLWQALDSIRAFAGADLELAVVADEAAAVLTAFDQRVRHYEIVLQDGLR